jgi:hypothetical protein
VPPMIWERDSANLVHIDATNDRKSSIEWDMRSMSARSHIQLVWRSVAMSA